MSAFVERMRRQHGEPEDSVALRVVVALLVEVSLLAVVVQGAVDAVTATLALVLAPVGYVFSHVRRRSPSSATKVALVVALLLALGAFIQAASLARSFDEARRPLAALFLWVQVLHAFDVPRRRDLGFSVVSSLILMAEAGVLSFGTGFATFLVPWLGLAGAWLFMTLEPPRRALASVVEVRRVRVSSRTRPLATATTVGGWVVVVLVSVGVVFALLPRLPGTNVSLPPFSVRDPTGVAGFRGQVVNPQLSAGLDGVPAFTELAYPGFGSSLDLRARGRLSDRVVMQVRSPQAMLWRGQAFDTYDGARWTASDDDTAELRRVFEEEGLPVPEPPEGAGVQLDSRRVVSTVFVRAPMPNVVLAPYRPVEVFFPTTTVSVDRYTSVRAPILLEEGVIYSVVSEVPVAAPEILRLASPRPGADPPDPDDLARYTQLPPSLPERVTALAERITGGESTQVDRVEAVESWLRANTRYNLEIPADPPGVDAVDHFLFERREGYCEQIASSMVVLLRAAGIPSRLVTGYGPGSRNALTGYFDVRGSDAHAWVEVLYPGAGWISYDPTFGVPPVGVGPRFLAPQLLGAVGRFVSSAVPEPVKDAVRAAGSALVAAVRWVVAAWPAVVLAIVGAALAWRLVRRRLRAPGRRRGTEVGAALAFAELDRAMAERGHARRDHQTPEEFLRALRPYLGAEERADAELVVRLFELERFSGRPRPDEDAGRALAAAGRIREGR
ncbi:MAG TPA: transglutaminaseTgpA domain-containing protein [Actinomycetota bacterium]